MEQLNFCFGSTLGTRDVLLWLMVGRVCLNLYKDNFMSLCNSFITERSLGYARQIWPPYVPCVVEHQTDIYLFFVYIVDMLYKCIMCIFHYTTTAVRYYNYDPLICQFREFFMLD